MAATALPVHTITHTGSSPAAPVAADATNGNQLATNNGTTTMVRAVNTIATPATVTLTYTVNVDGQTVPARSYTVPASGEVWFVVGPTALVGTQPLITASANTVTLAAYQV